MLRVFFVVVVVVIVLVLVFAAAASSLPSPILGSNTGPCTFWKSTLLLHNGPNYVSAF